MASKIHLWESYMRSHLPLAHLPQGKERASFALCMGLCFAIDIPYRGQLFSTCVHANNLLLAHYPIVALYGSFHHPLAPWMCYIITKSIRRKASLSDPPPPPFALDLSSRRWSRFPRERLFFLSCICLFSHPPPLIFSRLIR